MVNLVSLSGQRTPSVRGRRILVVEDEYMLAEDLREDLESQGAEVMGPVASVADAMDLLRSGPAPDMAILDINLGGEMAFAVADALRAGAVPFIFATGYDAQAIPAAYADVPRSEKPVEVRLVASKLIG